MGIYKDPSVGERDHKPPEQLILSFGTLQSLHPPKTEGEKVVGEWTALTVKIDLKKRQIIKRLSSTSHQSTTGFVYPDKLHLISFFLAWEFFVSDFVSRFWIINYSRSLTHKINLEVNMRILAQNLSPVHTPVGIFKTHFFPSLWFKTKIHIHNYIILVNMEPHLEAVR